jgi:uncharacterized C2H2 Zn-finger protein
MVKINPGSNVYRDNNTRTAGPNPENIKVPEPKMLGKNKLQCPECDAIFDSREKYISHHLAKHPTKPKTKLPENMQTSSVSTVAMDYPSK